MLRLDVRKLRIRWEYLLGIIKIGLPAGLQSMVFSLSNVVIQAAINSFGSDGIAGSTAEQNFEFMAYFVINAFAQTATTFTSQNFAAQDKERCKKIYRLCTFIGLASWAESDIPYWQTPFYTDLLNGRERYTLRNDKNVVSLPAGASYGCLRNIGRLS